MALAAFAQAPAPAAPYAAKPVPPRRVHPMAALMANPAAWVMADIFLFPCYFRLMRSLHGRLLPNLEADDPEQGKVIPLRETA